jgi:hypothetical protein
MEETLNTNQDTQQSKHTVDQNDFIMPNVDAICKVIFATHFIAYVKDTVKNSILAVYKSNIQNCELKMKKIEAIRDIIRDGNVIFATTIVYLNQTWLNYHKNLDNNVNSKIDLMKKNGKFLHTSCLFSYVWDFCQILLIYTLGRIDSDELRDADFLGDCIDVITDGILAFHVDTINNRDFACNENCEVSDFNGKQDFITIKKK